jgi:Type I phosphodiesterase / nucleotide pyrophosphatase
VPKPVSQHGLSASFLFAQIRVHSRFKFVTVSSRKSVWLLQALLRSFLGLNPRLRKKMRLSATFVIDLGRSAGTFVVCGLFTGALIGSVQQIDAAPKVIVISLDGATPRFVNRYLASGALPPSQGIGLLKRKGVYAERNVTVSPSLTAVGHIAIATGSMAAHNDIAANTFHLVASPFTTTISGFGSPIGGYQITGPAMSDSPTAEPIWVALRAASKKVVCATFPGADGLDVVVPGTNGAVVQPSSRTYRRLHRAFRRIERGI